MNIFRQFFNKNRQLAHFLKWSLWVFALFFYFYEFLLSVYPSFMVDALKETFQIDPEKISFIVNVYFYTFAPLQLSIGCLIDRYGARNLLTCATFICGVSALVFAFAPNVAFVAIARLFVGLGSCFAFVGMLHLTSHWCSKKQMNLLIGIANSCAMIVGATGEGPTSVLETCFGWRQTVGLHGAIGLILSFIFLLTLRKQPIQAIPKESKAFKDFKLSTLAVIKNPLSWINAFITFFLYAICSLWGISFLEEAHNLSKNEALFGSSLIWFGWIFGNLSSGMVYDRIQNRRYLLMLSSFFALLTLLPLAYTENLPSFAAFLLLFFFGFFAADLLTFSYSNGMKNNGSFSLSSFLVMVVMAFFQPLFCFLLDFLWTKASPNEIAPFSVKEFQLIITVFSLILAIAFFLTVFSKDKKKFIIPKQPEELDLG